MEKVLGIGGLFFRARDPQKLAHWYTNHLGIEIKDAVWHQLAGPTVFAPFKHDSDYFGRLDQQWMINFRVANLAAMIAQLEVSGIAVETKNEWDSDVGRFARVYDPKVTQSNFGNLSKPMYSANLKLGIRSKRFAGIGNRS